MTDNLPWQDEAEKAGILPGRLKGLNARVLNPKGGYVLYWMQASQRAEWNHALEYAALAANHLHKPLVCAFGLTGNYPEANLRHYAFMLEGLAETADQLRRRGVAFILRKGPPESIARDLAHKACLTVADRGYLRHQRGWRIRLAEAVPCPVVQVESDVVVPIEEVSGKEEYAAATLRPKIRRLLPRYLIPLQEQVLEKDGRGLDLESLDSNDTNVLLAGLNIDRTVPPAPGIEGGARTAHARLETFLRDGLTGYDEKRNDPAGDGQSGLSPYLHFGQLSPLEAALCAHEEGGPAADAFLEELVVRRELGLNFVYYNNRYDRSDCLPAWVMKTLDKHAADPRPYLYDRAQLEAAETHDPYWDAAQREMVRSGKMHGYMRMYWGKKIIEWSTTPREAWEAALYLNNKYELDGRDPNGYAGVAWCFGKHDRPWGERPVFGMLRWMSPDGLRRKFDMEAYLARWGA
jgi:deoxyribodipyrimidine photo-lyase